VAVEVGTCVFVATGTAVGSEVAVGGTTVEIVVAVGTGVSLGAAVGAGDGNGIGAGVGMGTGVAVGSGDGLGVIIAEGEGVAVGVDVAAGISVLVSVVPETTGALVGSDSTVGVQANAADIATATDNNKRRPRGVRSAGLSITTSEATRFRLPSHWEFRATIRCNVGIPVRFRLHVPVGCRRSRPEVIRLVVRSGIRRPLRHCCPDSPVRNWYSHKGADCTHGPGRIS